LSKFKNYCSSEEASMLSNTTINWRGKPPKEQHAGKEVPNNKCVWCILIKHLIVVACEASNGDCTSVKEVLK
jgi:hypothetical protein